MKSLILGTLLMAIAGSVTGHAGQSSGGSNTKLRLKDTSISVTIIKCLPLSCSLETQGVTTLDQLLDRDFVVLKSFRTLDGTIGYVLQNLDTREVIVIIEN